MTIWGRHPARALAAPLGPLWLCAAAFVVNRFTGLDLLLTQAFYDPAARAFPWREQWFAVTVLHDGARLVSALAAAALLGVVLFTSTPGGRRWRAVREPALFTLLTGALAALAVVALKRHSLHSCPWDLRLFGGAFDHFRLLAPLPAHPGPGQCLPSGHAATGFMWVAALYAAARWPQALPRLRLRGWRAAWAAFAAASSLVQVARGAHFLSHVLIGAAVCWAVAWAMDLAWHRLKALATLPLGAPPAEAAGPVIGGT